MAVPKRRTSKARRDRRRAHKKLKAVQLVECPRCFELKLPHRVCMKCGFYKDRNVVEIEG
ncbi:MAG: 50S ribosomal protein L32 [Dethiobacteria bacterium]